MINIEVYGARGSYGTDFKQSRGFGNSTTCFGIWLDNEVIFMDAGTGLPLAQETMLEGSPKAVTIALTHMHHDHTSGLLGTKQLYFNPDGVEVDVVGPYKIFSGLNFEFANFVSPISLDILSNLRQICSLPPNQSFRTQTGQEIVSFVAGWHPSNSGLSEGDLHYEFHRDYGVQGYILEAEGKKIVFSTDMEFKYKREGGKIIPFTEDQIQQRINQFIRAASGADVLIMDGQFTESEYENVRGFGHETFEGVYNIALYTKAKKLIISHHNPGRTDTELFEISRKLNRRSNLEVILAKQGLKLEV